ncbi:protein of unknown function (DUF3472) [Echinicola vietnamensis DSM 17526]|uniref:DUF5077 domain-containing protein n=2 Tax=Echinicola TaxID=390846 RepID=L0G0J7_ECHVK|nr:protein of unknown function (DUF3472) [Echinicola vietnamensis DSM 17526]
MSIKRLLPMAAMVVLLACESSGVQEEANAFQETTEIPLGGNAYVTTGTGVEVTRQGVQHWISSEAVLSTYFKTQKPQQVFLQLVLGARNAPCDFMVTAGGQRKEVSVTAQGSDTVHVGKFDLDEGYVKVDIQGVSKEGEAFSAIKSLLVKTKDNAPIVYVKDNESNRYYWGRRGPSVHLSYEVPENKNFKWFYSEITVPEGEDPNGSYYMANGFGEGYFGIQANADDERRVLFSVWSPFHTDNPEEIPEDQQIKLLKKGEGVYTGEFGNEGSGGQSYWKYQWITGNTYRFLNSVEPDGQGNTIYTAYFYAPELGEWKLIASFLRPQSDTWYKRPHSFLENFNDKNGYLGRKAFYHDQWAMDTEGHWTALTTAKFTGDDIARRGYRMDYAGGVENGQFFLQNGGFFNDFEELNSMHQRSATNQEPAVDVDALP